MASMNEIFEERRKEILGKVKILIKEVEKNGCKHDHITTSKCHVLVPETWMEDRAADIMNAVLGKARLGWNSWETTKAAKLLDAEAALRSMKIQAESKFKRVWWHPRTYNDLLELLADLAGEIRTGKVKMHWPKYESLVEEVIGTYFAYCGFKMPKSGSVPIRLFGLIGIDTVIDIYDSKRESKWDGRRLLKDEIKDGKWEGTHRPDKSNKWNIFE